MSFVTFRKLPLPWGNEDTPRILETLKKHNVKVTFFMTGGWVESYPEDVRAILADGHDLGNHSENHKNMSQLSDEQCQEELMKVHTKVQELTGYEMFLFRPLMHNGAKYTADALDAVITGLQEKGYELVPISQLIYKDKYHMKADGTQVSGE